MTAAARPNLARERALLALLQVLDEGMHLDLALDTVWSPVPVQKTSTGRGGRGPWSSRKAGRITAPMADSSTGVRADAAPGGSGRDRALSQEICFGVLRWLPRLRAIASALLARPFKARDRDVELALLIGLYQAAYLRMPPHAAVSSAVELTAFRHKRWAGAVVNGCLRRYLREQAQIHQQLKGSQAARYAHPQWLLDRIRTDWPEHASAIVQANQQRAPMTLRVNTRVQSRDDYLARLRIVGLAATPCAHAESGIVLTAPVAVSALPGFEVGAVSIQDEAAQLAAPLLAPTGAARVLDACAAPGGKSAHLLESFPDIAELVCLDSSADRTERLKLNLERLSLGARATVVEGRAETPRHWWDGKPFTAILVDSPCTATGVIRRHPDIKVLRRPGDVTAIVATQHAIVEALWPLLVPGGRLLYATCSILPAENDAVVESLVGSQPDASVRTITAEWGIATRLGRQILPGVHDMDGFYYALIEKSGA